MAATNYRAGLDMCLNTIRPRVAPTKKLALHNQWPQAVAAEMEAVGHVAKDGKRAPPSPSRACASDWNRQHNPGIT
jgi:hypothetical protein